MKKGFTLIELLIVIAIFGVIVGVTISAFWGVLHSQSLTRGVHDVASIITDARRRTMSGENDVMYGVVVASTTIALVRGPEYDVASSTSVVYELPRSVELQSFTTSTSTITFDSLTGHASVSGQFVYAHAQSTTTTQSVTIETSGLVTVD